MNVLEAKDLSFAYGNTPVLMQPALLCARAALPPSLALTAQGKHPFTAAVGGVETHGRAYRTDGAGHRQLQKAGSVSAMYRRMD